MPYGESVETVLGRVRIGATADGVCRVEFVGPEFGNPTCPGVVGNRWTQLGVRELLEYLEGRRREFTVPLVVKGTAFQARVWKGLQTIPHGDTWSYSTLAERVGCPGGQRAVGLANGRNPVPILIPCHRVVAQGGGLGGYSPGLWRKRWLLELEARVSVDGRRDTGSGGSRSPS